MAKEYRNVSVIIERENRKAFFQKIGVAFDNRDGSLNFQIPLFPGVKFHIGIPKVNTGNDADHPDEDTPF